MRHSFCTLKDEIVWQASSHLQYEVNQGINCAVVVGACAMQAHSKIQNYMT